MFNCLKIVLEGRVQGVGFRNFALSKAIKFNIRGNVRNTVEGNLEIICCGKKEDIEKFLFDIKKGPSFAYVSKITINDYTGEKDFKSFEITY